MSDKHKVLARTKGSGDWRNYGNQTHVDAAEIHAHLHAIDYAIVETKFHDGETIFEHEVQQKRTYVVTPLRGDCDATT